MTYIPISPKERDAMLETIGVKSLDDLFDAIPAKHRFPKLNLPPALTEMEAMDELSGLAQANENVRRTWSPSSVRACTTTTSPRSWTISFAAVSSIPPTLPTSRRSPRAHCKPSLNTNP